MKADINKIISKLKLKQNEVPKHKASVKAPTKSYRERDMRQDAIDMGSHQAEEFFGVKNDTPK